MTIDPYARLVLYRLREMAAERGDPVAFTTGKLADSLGVSQRTVYRALKTLRNAGMIEPRRDGFGGWGRPSLYRVGPRRTRPERADDV